MNAQQLNKKIRERQISLNHQTVRKNKNTQISPLRAEAALEDPSSPERGDGSLEKKVRMRGEEYGSLLKEQMTMNRIEDENSLSKSRKIDMDNANYFRQKYPFGFEGVKVCEGVIEKYKASNYTIQKNMLEKFQREAEEFRRNRHPNQSRPLFPRSTHQERFSDPSRDLIHLSPPRITQEELNRQSLLELEMLRQREREEQRRRQEQEERRRRKELQRELKRQQRSEVYLKREKENLIKVGNMLRQIDHKLKENSPKLTADLRDLRNQLKQSPKFHAISEANLLKITNKIVENTQSCSKIPVVLYNSNLNDSRLYYDESSHHAPRINRKDFDNSSAHIKDVLRILRKNEHRLKMLTQVQDTQEEDANSSCTYLQ